MRALMLVDESQDKISIRETEKPTPSAKEVLIKLKAASLNHRDQWCRMGMYPNLTYDAILGSDGSGIVEATGDGLSKKWLGKDVIVNPNIDWGTSEMAQSAQYHILGMPSNGTFGEFMVVGEDRLSRKPEHLSFAEAAALPLGGLTAYRAVFTKGEISKGQRVLITGIGGGVAQFAFQFALAARAEVYVTSGRKEKIDKIKSLGASGGFNYKEDNWYKSAEIEDGFDVIIDGAGGDSLDHYLKIIKAGGNMVHYGSTSGMPNKLDLFKLFWSQANIKGTSMGSDNEFLDMIDFVDEHKVVPFIDSIRPFDQIISAFDEMHEGKQFGKLVVEY